MARRQKAAASPRQERPSDRRRGAGDDPVGFGRLLDEVTSLREALASSEEEIRRLRAEWADAIDLLHDVTETITPGTRRRSVAGGRPAPRAGDVPAGGRGRRGRRPTADAGPRRASRGPGVNGRVTAASVTTELVRSVIAELGSATAGEIAERISSSGTPVSGRAIRHIAESAGAVTRPGSGGRRVYSLR